MPATKKLIDEVLSLPVEDRARIVISLLESLNKPNPSIDKEWTNLAKRRLEEIRSGKVNPIPGEEVFQKIQTRFAK